MTKLTEEDREWLERRLNDAARGTIAPRPEFIARAHDELMGIELKPARRVRSGVLIALIFSICGLISALLLLGQRRRAT
jgi:hypothetical protein